MKLIKRLLFGRWELDFNVSQFFIFDTTFVAVCRRILLLLLEKFMAVAPSGCPFFSLIRRIVNFLDPIDTYMMFTITLTTFVLRITRVCQMIWFKAYKACSSPMLGLLPGCSICNFNPFISNAPFLYPQKTSENRKKFWKATNLLRAEAHIWPQN